MAKIVHQLFNVRSGLCLHVAAIDRNAETSAGEVTRETAAKVLANALGMPDRVLDVARIDAAGGGILHVQTYLGPYESASSPAHVLMAQGDDHINGAHLTEAAAAYQEVLRINRQHTVAMNNLAYCQARLGELPAALDSMSAALAIEPNYLPYYRSYVEYAAAAHMLDAALSCFERMKDRFDHEFSIDRLAVDIYLAAGRPDAARRLFESMPFRWADAELVEQSVAADLAAMDLCAKALTSAREAVLNRRDPDALTWLRSATEMYPRSPWAAVNLGLALGRAGEMRAAYQALRSARHALPAQQSLACFANMAFIAVAAGEAEAGLGMLRTAVSEAGAPASGDEVNYSAVPGVAVWIEREGVLEASPGRALNIISKGIEMIEQTGAADRFRALARIYTDTVRWYERRT
jgi:tetratricopeptide (TPR) repeat protein